MKYIVLLILGMIPFACEAQSAPTYDYAVPYAVTSFAGGKYTVNSTTSTAIPFVDYAVPFFPVCYNSSTNKYAACPSGSGSGIVSPGTGSAGSPAVYSTSNGTTLQSAPNGCVFDSTGLDACPIGQTTPAVGSFTSLKTSGSGSWYSGTGDVGNVLPPLSNGGTAIGWDYAAGNGESDFVNSPSAGSAPGFRFYYYSGGTMKLLANLDANGSLTLTKALIATQARSGVSGNTDLVGSLAIASAATTTTASYVSTSGGYTTAPICTVQAQNATPGTLATMGSVAPQVAVSGGNFTLSVNVQSAPGTAVTMGYICAGRN